MSAIRVLKRTLALEVVSPHFIFRSAKLICRPADWEEYIHFGEAKDVFPPACTLIDNHAEIEISNDGDYWLEMANVVIETVSLDKTFEIPFYFHSSNLSINESNIAVPLRINITANVVYSVTLLDRTRRPIDSGILKITLPRIPMTVSIQLGKEGSIMFLGNPTYYVFDLSHELGLKILPA